MVQEIRPQTIGTFNPLTQRVAQLVKNPPAMLGEPGWIPGSGRSAGEGIGYPLQYSWAFLVDQLVKNQPAGDLGSIPGLGRSSGEGNEWLPTPVAFLENSMDRGACQAIVHGVAKSQRRLSNFHFQ